MAKKVLITGAKGFIGRNLTAELKRFPDKYQLLLADVDTSPEMLLSYLGQCDFVVHLAGVNRPKDEKEFSEGNADVTRFVTDALAQNSKKVPIALTSSIQAALDNPYGHSKLEAERAVLNYREKTGANTYIFRLPNVFGKWCRPNYNSAVATFCYNIARGLPITLSDGNRIMTLIYIDDVVALLKGAIGEENFEFADGYCVVKVTHEQKLGEIAEKIQAFHRQRADQIMPVLQGSFDRALYATYLSALDEADFSYELTVHADARGLFAEFFKSREAGQISVSVTKPNVQRGSHWHHTKAEKFLVVAGKALIRFRLADGSEVIEYNVSGDRPQVVDIPPGYTHSIDNLSGTEDLVTVIWASELFDPECPDTYPMEV